MRRSHSLVRRLRLRRTSRRCSAPRASRPRLARDRHAGSGEEGSVRLADVDADPPVLRPSHPGRKDELGSDARARPVMPWHSGRGPQHRKLVVSVCCPRTGALQVGTLMGPRGARPGLAGRPRCSLLIPTLRSALGTSSFRRRVSRSQAPTSAPSSRQVKMNLCRTGMPILAVDRSGARVVRRASTRVHGALLSQATASLASNSG